MTALRFLASLFLLIATVVLVADLTPWLGGHGRLETLSFAEYWQLLSPATFAATEEGISHSFFDWAWALIIRPLIGLPAFLIFAALALIAGYFGRHRSRINIYQA